MVRKLAAARAQVDKTTTRGHTPLHYAAWGGAWRKGFWQASLDIRDGHSCHSFTGVFPDCLLFSATRNTTHYQIYKWHRHKCHVIFFPFLPFCYHFTFEIRKTQLIHGCTPTQSQCQCHVIVASMGNYVRQNSKAPRFSCLESFHFSRSLGSDTSIAGSWSRQTFVRSEQARCQCLFHGSDSRHLGLFKQRCW